MNSFKILFPSGYRIKDMENDNIDVNVILSDKTVYFATFFTLLNIKKIMSNERGVYFWATDMVILKDLRRETIESAIEEIIRDGYLDLAFSKIGTIESVYSRYSSFDDINDI